MLLLETTNIAKTDIVLLLQTTSPTRNMLETNKNAIRSSSTDASKKHCYINLNSATPKTTIIATTIIYYC